MNLRQRVLHPRDGARCALAVRDDAAEAINRDVLAAAARSCGAHCEEDATLRVIAAG